VERVKNRADKAYVLTVHDNLPVCKWKLTGKLLQRNVTGNFKTLIVTVWYLSVLFLSQTCWQ